MQQLYVCACTNQRKYKEGYGASPFIDYLDKLSASIKTIYFGSVVYVIQFKTTQELIEFKRQLENGELRAILEKELIVPERMPVKRDQFIAEIDDDEFNRCKKELDLLSKCSFKDVFFSILLILE